MNKNKLIIALSVLVSSHLLSLTVLPRQESAGAATGKALGDSIRKGFEQAMEANRQAMADERQTQLEIIQQAIILRQQQINMEKLEALLEGYEPSKNREYILKILKSDLPERMKESTIKSLNECHEQYLKENESWFSRLFGWGKK